MKNTLIFLIIVSIFLCIFIRDDVCGEDNSIDITRDDASEEDNSIDITGEDSEIINYIELEKREKSPWVGVGLNIIYPGLGNMYAGKYIKGSLMLMGYAFIISQMDISQLYYDTTYLSIFGAYVAYAILSGVLDVNSYNKELRKKYNIAVLLPTEQTPVMFVVNKRF